jgi:hypothetical protein
MCYAHTVSQISPVTTVLPDHEVEFPSPRSPLHPAEQRQVLAADERRRQFHEAKRARLESHAEEEGDGELLKY